MQNIGTDKIILTIIVVIVCYFGYRSYSSMENNPSKTENHINTEVNVKPVIPIEEYIKYSIIRKNEIGTEKLSLAIRLQKEYKKSDLKKFANYIKDEYATKPYKRIFLTYYLPNMEVGNGAWATSHFTPNLQVLMTSRYFDDAKEDIRPEPNRIQNVITEYSKNPSGKVFIGFWSQNEDFINVLFRKNGKYYLNELNINTQSKGDNYELIVGSKNGKQTFVIRDLLYPKNDSGTKYIGDYTDYYLIDSNGDLVLYDEIGILEKYLKITP